MPADDNPTRQRVLRHAHCSKCGYPLRGLNTNRCPECGQPFDPRSPGTYDAGRRDGTVPGWVVALALAALLGAAMVWLGRLMLAWMW